jgi:hypothetical protein
LGKDILKDSHVLVDFADGNENGEMSGWAKSAYLIVCEPSKRIYDTSEFDSAIAQVTNGLSLKLGIPSEEIGQGDSVSDATQLTLLMNTTKVKSRIREFVNGAEVFLKERWDLFQKPKYKGFYKKDDIAGRIDRLKDKLDL